MKRILVILFGISFTWNLFSQTVSEQILMSPEEYFGFEPGTDRNLFDYNQLISYLQKLDQLSDRILLTEAGETPQGRKMYIAFISSPDNLNRLESLRRINKSLALDGTLSDIQRDSLVKAGKVFLLATLSMHSTEVAPSQAAPLIVFKMATTVDPDVLKWMEDVVFMLIPNHNPDGMQMVVENYLKYKGTKYEGGSFPGLYHAYVGHDNNRDFVTLTQKDTRVIAGIYSTEWFPQVMIEKHQMGATGVRYFVPPMHDPIAENVDERVWNWTWVFGSAMAKDMTAAGCAGVAQHYLFDDYWPGSTETALWKNMIGLLTEAASVNLATPVYIEKNELRVGGKGLSEYKKSINMPLPWEGGWWRLSDLVRYEMESTWSLIKTCSQYKEEILQFRNEMCRNEIQKGKTQAPSYFIIPNEQHDRGELSSLVNLLLTHGIKVYQLNHEVSWNSRILRKGDVVIPLSQPYRAFIKEIMEPQQFPVRHYTPGGEIIKPYDITSWSLPLHKGLEVFQVPEVVDVIENTMIPTSKPYSLIKEDLNFSKGFWLFPSSLNESYMAAFRAMSLNIPVFRTQKDFVLENQVIPAGSFLVSLPQLKAKEMVDGLTVAPLWFTENPDPSAIAVSMPRIALMESWFHDMDAGWTRFILDQYKIPFTLLRPSDLKKIPLEGKFDVLILPDEDKNVLMEGKYKSGDDYYLPNYPPDYSQGMGKEGFQKVLKFLKDGGIILSWGASCSLFEGTLSLKLSETETEEFKLPFSNVSENLKKNGLLCPGSLLRIELLGNHPLTWGLKKEAGIFARGEPVFQTSVPVFDTDRRVIASYPESKILLSGYCEKEELLVNKAAMVWLKKAQGDLVVYGFNPQFRASTPGTYKLLFNGLLLKSSHPMEVR